MPTDAHAHKDNTHVHTCTHMCTHTRNTLLLGGRWRLRSHVGSRAKVLEGYGTVFNQARQFSVWGLDLLDS